MPKVKYVGPHDAVRITLPSGGEAVVKHGESREFGDTFAKQLLEQPDNWTADTTPAKAKNETTKAGE